MATKRTTRTKAETKTAFAEVAASTRGKESISAREQEAADARNAEVRNNVADLSVEKALNGVTKTNLEVTKALSAVTEQLVETTKELETVKLAVSLEKAELNDLYKKDVAASAIEDLVADYNEKKASFDTLAADQRAAWLKEETDHNTLVRERNDQLSKLRAREEAEYQYKTQLERRAAQDKFNEELRAQAVTERDRRESVLRDHATREIELKNRENDLASYKAQVDAFPAKLDADVKKAVAIAENSIKREYEHKIQLMLKDSETSKVVAAAEIASLNQQVVRANAQIADLQNRITASDSRVAEIASKAIDGASGKLALDTAMSIKNSDGNGASRKS